MYTERQKKHHFFRATLTKIHCIWINYIETQGSYSSPYEAHLKTLKIAFAKKEKSQKVTFQKSQKLLAKNLHERLPIQNIQ